MSRAEERRRAQRLAKKLWSDRDKIEELLGQLAGSRERITDVVEFLGEQGEDIVELVQRVPELLAEAGEVVEAAGAASARVTKVLAGTDGLDMDELKEVADELGSIAGRLRGFGENVGSLRPGRPSGRVRDATTGKKSKLRQAGAKAKKNPIDTSSRRKRRE